MYSIKFWGKLTQKSPFGDFQLQVLFHGMQIVNLSSYLKNLHKNGVLPQRTHTIEYDPKCNAKGRIINSVSVF